MYQSPPSTHTHMMNNDFFRSLRANRDCGSRSVWIRSRIPVVWWRAAVELTLLLRNPLGSHMRERGRRMRRRREKSPSKELPQSTCVKLSSKGAPYIGGRGHPYPSTKQGGTKGGGFGAPWPRTALASHPLGPIWPIPKALGRPHTLIQ
jgi:hypothetical protein